MFRNIAIVIVLVLLVAPVVSIADTPKTEGQPATETHTVPYASLEVTEEPIMGMIVMPDPPKHSDLCDECRPSEDLQKETLRVSAECDPSEQYLSVGAEEPTTPDKASPPKRAGLSKGVKRFLFVTALVICGLLVTTRRRHERLDPLSAETKN